MPGQLHANVCMCMCVVSTRFVLSDYFDAISDVCIYMWVFSPLSCLRVLANRLHMIASLRVLPDRLLIPTAQDGVMVRFAIPPAHCSVDLACVYVHVMSHIYTAITIRAPNRVSLDEPLRRTSRICGTLKHFRPPGSPRHKDK